MGHEESACWIPGGHTPWVDPRSLGSRKNRQRLEKKHRFLEGAGDVDRLVALHLQEVQFLLDWIGKKRCFLEVAKESTYTQKGV